MSHILSVRAKGIVLSFLPLFAFIIIACGGTISPTFSHQGKLLDSSGNPVANGNYTVMYRLYHDDDSGTPVYTDTNTVSVTDGYFDSAFGDSAVDPKVFSEKTWLEITINGETLTPRQRLHGAPYASGLVAGSAAIGSVPVTYTYGTYDNLGSAFFAANIDSTATGGSGLTAVTSALIPSGSAAKKDVAAVRGLSVGDGSIATGAYGGIFVSEDYRGIYAKGNDSFYAGYFESSTGIYVQGPCVGCAMSMIAQNVDTNTIELGDFVAAVGVEIDPDYEIPILLVRKAVTGDAILGVAASAMSRNAYDDSSLTQAGYVKSADAAQPDAYISIVTEGLVQAQLPKESALEIGDFITMEGAKISPTRNVNESIAQVMSETDDSGLQWILLNR